MVRAHMAARATKCVAFALCQVKTLSRPSTDASMHFLVSRSTRRTVSQITADLMINATKRPSRRAGICDDIQGHANVCHHKARVATPPSDNKYADQAAVCSRCTTEVVSSLALRSLTHITVRDSSNGNARSSRKHRLGPEGVVLYCRANTPCHAH
jgi:hypothetical protein